MTVEIRIHCKTIAELFAHFVTIAASIHREKKRLSLTFNDEDLHKANPANLSFEDAKLGKHTVEIFPS